MVGRWWRRGAPEPEPEPIAWPGAGVGSSDDDADGDAADGDGLTVAGCAERVSEAAARSRRIGEPAPARHSATTHFVFRLAQIAADLPPHQCQCCLLGEAPQLDRLALTEEFAIGRREHEGGVGSDIEDRREIVGRADQVVGDDATRTPGQQPPQFGRAGPESGGLVRTFEDLLGHIEVTATAGVGI